MRRALALVASLALGGGTAAGASTLPVERSDIGPLPPGFAMQTTQRTLWEVPNGVDTGITVYDNTVNLAGAYYAGQAGAEAIDDLHLTGPGAGALSSVCFGYLEPTVNGETVEATVTIYDNPGGLDVSAVPLAGPFVVAGLPQGLNTVTVAVPGGVVLDGDLWMGVRFDSSTAGLVICNPPALGTSHDYYLEDGQLYYFGGDPPANFDMCVESDVLVATRPATWSALRARYAVRAGGGRP